MNNNLPTLAKYNGTASLVEIRRDPERFPRIGSFSAETAAARMLSIVWAASLYRNQDLSDDKLAFISSALVAEIMNDRKYGLRQLSWEEIGVAIRAAVLGEGREMYGISVASLFTALVDYAKGDGHEADKKA